jgi:hypothetical protein
LNTLSWLTGAYPSATHHKYAQCVYVRLNTSSCHVDRTFSFGNGEFHYHNDDTPMTYAFSVYKDIALGKLDVTIWSVFLRHALALTDPYIINLPALIQQYPFLRDILFGLDEPNSLCASHENAKELRLLIEGLLLDRKIFNGFNLEHLYDQGIISRTHWQDIQHWSTMNDLRVIDEAFQKLCHSQAEEANEDDEDLPSGDVLSLLSRNQGRCSAAFDRLQENRIPSSSTTRSADYQILRSIQTLWEQLPNIDSNPQELIDFEDAWIWELHKSCDISWAEQNWLDRVIGDCEASREIKLLLCSSGLKDVSRLRKTIILPNAVDDPRGAIHHSYDPTFCSVRPLSVAEKRDFLEKRLHAVFKEEDQRFRDKVRKINWERQPAGYKRAASMDIGSCSFIFQWYNRAWNKGVATIRRFLQGRRPGTLEQICRLLQVAYAMGSQDPTNPNFRASFANDLDRWRTIVPEHSLLYFDAIVEVVWNKTFDKVQSNGAMDYGSDENLLYLQQLLSGLISCNPVAEISKDDEQQAEPVRTDEQMFNAGLSARFSEAQYVLDGFEDPRAYSHVRKQPFCWEPAEPVVVLMMAGAIFGFIFSFLLSEYPYLCRGVTKMSLPTPLYFLKLLTCCHV